MSIFGTIAISGCMLLLGVLIGFIVMGVLNAGRISDLVDENDALRATLLGAEQA